jgi:hypothetical protein
MTGRVERTRRWPPQGPGRTRAQHARRSSLVSDRFHASWHGPTTGRGKWRRQITASSSPAEWLRRSVTSWPAARIVFDGIQGTTQSSRQPAASPVVAPKIYCRAESLKSPAVCRRSRNGVIAYAVQTAVNSGPELMIFVLPKSDRP